MNNWNAIINKKIILFIVGFCGYITIETLWRGYSFSLMGIVAGLLIVILDELNNYWTFDMDFLLQSVIGAMIITYAELIIGEFAKYSGLLPVMWNYDNMPLNFDGVICLPFSLLWILFSAAAILIADAINYYVLGDDEQPYYKIFGKELLTFKKK